MLWILGFLFAFTILSFVAATVATQIMALVHGTPTQAALEDRCKQSWYRVERLLGYHPLNQVLWFTMINYPAMPLEAQGKQRALRVILVLQLIAFAAVFIGIVVSSLR